MRIAGTPNVYFATSLKGGNVPAGTVAPLVTNMLCVPYDVRKSEFGGVISETTKQIPEPLQPSATPKRSTCKILEKCFEIFFDLVNKVQCKLIHLLFGHLF